MLDGKKVDNIFSGMGSVASGNSGSADFTQVIVGKYENFVFDRKTAFK